MVSTTNHGNILIWHCPMNEKWSAFAGDFEELDENVEYIEKEDEFDIEDEQEITARKMRAEEEDVDIEGWDDETIAADLNPKGNENGNGWEEDTRWAEEHPDADTANWAMRIVMRDDE